MNDPERKIISLNVENSLKAILDFVTDKDYRNAEYDCCVVVDTILNEAIAMIFHKRFGLNVDNILEKCLKEKIPVNLLPTSLIEEAINEMMQVVITYDLTYHLASTRRVNPVSIHIELLPDQYSLALMRHTNYHPLNKKIPMKMDELVVDNSQRAIS